MSKLDCVGLSVLLPNMALDAAAANLIEAETKPSVAISILAEAGMFEGALRLVAHCLPRREAVWWACMCAQHTAPADLPLADVQALATTQDWVRQQTDVLRRTAFAHGQEGGFQTPEAWAAVAAFWSGESLAPAHLPSIAPPPHLTAIAVFGAVSLAATRGAAPNVGRRQSAFLRSAYEIGTGGAGRLAHEAVADETVAHGAECHRAGA